MRPREGHSNNEDSREKDVVPQEGPRGATFVLAVRYGKGVAGQVANGRLSHCFAMYDKEVRFHSMQDPCRIALAKHKLRFLKVSVITALEAH